MAYHHYTQAPEVMRRKVNNEHYYYYLEEEEEEKKKVDNGVFRRGIDSIATDNKLFADEMRTKRKKGPRETCVLYIKITGNCVISTHHFPGINNTSEMCLRR